MPAAVMSPIIALLQQRQGCDSWNLYLDKFSFQRSGGPESKTEALQKAIKCYSIKATDHLGSAGQRIACWSKALQVQHTTRFRSVALFNQSPLVLHLGRASVLENVGLYCDRTTGLPMIPGSGVKGLLSTWATWEANQNADLSFPETKDWSIQRKDYPSDHARRILGCDSATGSEHAGDIIFVGAYPKNTPVLSVDLVNPHHTTNGSDLTHLTPNAFLCIQPGTLWNFIFYARPGTTDAEALLTTTDRWLCEALEHVGLGAKTAAGYGRFGLIAPPKPGAATRGKPATKEDLERQARDEKLKAGFLASMQSDFPNEQTFKTRILDKLNPGSLTQLEKEIAVLEKAENAVHLQVLKTLLASKDFKEIRKRLREKKWFPQDWLPHP